MDLTTAVCSFYTHTHDSHVLMYSFPPSAVVHSTHNYTMMTLSGDCIGWRHRTRIYRWFQEKPRFILRISLMMTWWHRWYFTSCFEDRGAEDTNEVECRETIGLYVKLESGEISKWEIDGDELVHEKFNKVEWWKLKFSIDLWCHGISYRRQ